MSKKLATEFFGTFFFLGTIAIVVPGGSPFAAFAIGIALMSAVYFGGHVSGAHYNPAVSLALFLRKKITSKELISYVAVQVVAGFLAFLMGLWVTGQPVNIAPTVAVPQAIAIEAFFTCFLALVVLNVATAKQMAGNHIYGLAIGFTIVAAALTGGPLSGGAFNPAVALGAALVSATKEGSLSNLWIYLIGPFGGSILAAVIYGTQHGTEAD